MTDDQVMGAVDDGLAECEKYLMGVIKSDRAKRADALVMLDLLPILGVDVIQAIRGAIERGRT